MTPQVLIEAIVQQTTVLLAKLATAGGVRAPLARIASQVFVDLATELEQQGLSRKVTADMFGISLRAYQRKMVRLRESDTVAGATLWTAVLDYVRGKTVATRGDVLKRFGRDDEEGVRAILHDLVESGLMFTSGTKSEDIYRAATEEELAAIASAVGLEGLDELLWSLIFSHGPLDLDGLVRLCRMTKQDTSDGVARLLAASRVEADHSGERTTYSAPTFFIPKDAPTGWEAAMYDHYQAVVRTLCNRLEPADVREPYKDSIGGSTYTFDVGPGHPLEGEVLGLLSRLRSQCHDLRVRVSEHNTKYGRTAEGENVVAYVGQSVVPRETLGGVDLTQPTSSGPSALT